MNRKQRDNFGVSGYASQSGGKQSGVLKLSTGFASNPDNYPTIEIVISINNKTNHDSQDTTAILSANDATELGLRIIELAETARATKRQK